MNQNVILRILILFFTIYVVSTVSIAAENKAASAAGGIRGKVVDADSKTPIEFSNVAAFITGQNNPVAIETSSADGSFFLKLNKGSYVLKFSFVGYETKTDSIDVTGFRPIEMGEVSLSMASSEIEAVVVKGEKSLYENKIDRKVFNVEKSIAAQSGTATDVLQQVPSVSVDVDGNVSLRGSENVNILINGRPTLIDKTVLLQQIAANSIEKIEVITNPSVKFDSEGTSGIINIVLKQGTAQGINGTVAINAGTNDDISRFKRYNGSVNINYNPGKFNLFGSYSYRDDVNRNWGETRKNIFSDTSFQFITMDGERQRQSHMFRTGIDIFASQKLTFGVNGSINMGDDKDTDRNLYNYYNSVYTTERWYRNALELEDNFSTEVAAYLTQKFNNDGHELKMDYSFGNGKENEEILYNQNTIYKIPNINSRRFIEKDSIKSTRSNHIISADYTLPMNEKMKLELGAKVIIRDNEDNQLSMKLDTTIQDTSIISMIEDQIKTSDYIYHEDISSVYGTYSLTLGNFSAMLGLKGEVANYKTDLVLQNQNFKNTFFSFIPSLHLVQKLNEENELNLSYSRRIERPRGHMLNPVPNYDDPTNIRIGNPNLRPSYTNSIEAGYTFKPEVFTIQPTIFYRIIQDRFSPYRETDLVSKISTIRFTNLDLSHSYGFDLAVTYKPFKFWNLNISGSAYQYTLEATEYSPEKQRFSYNGKIMSNTMLPKGFMVQLSAFYRSPFITAQGESDPFYMVNLGARKDLLKGKLTASLNFNDVFNTGKFAMNSTTNADYAEMWRKRESSILFLGLTYKFGKAPKNGKKQQRDNRTEEGMGDDMMF